MRAIATALPGVLILEPRVFGDARGFFLESYNRMTFAEATGVDVEFVQDNHSRSAKGVLRGMHLQAVPHAQVDDRIYHVARNRTRPAKLLTTLASTDQPGLSALADLVALFLRKAHTNCHPEFLDLVAVNTIEA